MRSEGQRKQSWQGSTHLFFLETSAALRVGQSGGQVSKKTLGADANGCHNSPKSRPPGSPAMNPLELFHILQAILRNEAKVIAAFLVGVVLTIVAAYIDLVKDLQQR